MLVHKRELILVGLLMAAPLAGQAQTTDPAVPPATTETEAPTAMAPAEEAQPIDGQIVMQSQETVLARDLLGARVDNPANEKVGDINNLIVNLDGTIEGVVIGVGGFLGMGEKDVAIEMATLSMQETAPGRVRLILASTREELEAAPAFQSLYLQQLEAETAAQPEPGQPMPGQSTPTN
ncbi:MAG: hypothetical protein B7Z02_01875 [Rhodobacterales bacterium 32-67-9]|nr:MAG: hypothetical protein B7Z02_01875 [Rhodobacterales bacterium 32-67-9]